MLLTLRRFIYILLLQLGLVTILVGCGNLQIRAQANNIVDCLVIGSDLQKALKCLDNINTNKFEYYVDAEGFTVFYDDVVDSCKYFKMECKPNNLPAFINTKEKISPTNINVSSRVVINPKLIIRSEEFGFGKSYRFIVFLDYEKSKIIGWFNLGTAVIK